MEKFDAASELAELRAETAVRRKRSYAQRKSRLDRYHGEIVLMYEGGGSIREIQRWLRKKKAIRVAESTVHRWIKNKEVDRG